MQITVVNWGEYQPRKDVKKSSWFRMEHAIALSTKYLALTQQDVMAIVYIFSLCSEENSETVTIAPQHVAIFGRMKEAELKASAIKLQQLGIVLVDDTPSDRARNVDVSLRTNEHNERTSSSAGSGAPAEAAQLFPAPSDVGYCTELKEIGDIIRARVKMAVQKRWLELYSAEFIVRKIRELDVWCLENPAKAPKSRWSTWYSGILAKDWEKYRRTMPIVTGQPVRPKSSWAMEQEARNAAEQK